MLFNRGVLHRRGAARRERRSLRAGPIWQLDRRAHTQDAFPKKLDVYPDLLESAGYHVGFTGKGWGPGDVKAGGRDRNPAGPLYAKKRLRTNVGAGIHDDDYAGNFALFLSERPQGRPFCFWYGGKEPHRSYEKGAGLKAGKKLADVAVPPYLPDIDSSPTKSLLIAHREETPFTRYFRLAVDKRPGEELLRPEERPPARS